MISDPNGRDDDDAEESGEGPGASPDYVKKLDEMLDRVEPLILSVNSSYSQYAAGVEVRAPIERRVQLDQMMNTLMLMAKPTPAYRFRYQNVQGMYNSYKKRWEKILQDLEDGKIKRFAGPQKKRGAA